MRANSIIRYSIKGRLLGRAGLAPRSSPAPVWPMGCHKDGWQAPLGQGAAIPWEGRRRRIVERRSKNRAPDL